MSDLRSTLRLGAKEEDRMARQVNHTPLHRHFRRQLSPQRIARVARETGFVQRKGKISAFHFVWTLTLGFAVGRDRTVSGLRRVYGRVTGTTLVPSSFYERFGAPLVALLRRLVDHLLATTVHGVVGIGGSLGGFAEVVVADATIIRLHQLLEKQFPACRTNHTKAAVKLHLVMSATAVSSRSVAITAERVNDRRKLRIGSWVRERLLLFDLGYFGYRLFDRIDRNGGYFVTRLKSSANPLITAVHRRWRGRAVAVVGQRVQDVLGRLQRAVLDVEVAVRFRRRIYRGRQSAATRSFRMVAIRNPETGAYHTYLTNVPANRLSAKDIALAYRARWQIELMFKACKSEFRIDHLPSRNKHVVQALIYASILTMLITQTLLRYIRSKLAEPAARRLTFGRAAAAVRAFGQELLRAVVGSLDSGETRFLERLITREALDPHLCRPTLIEQAAGLTTTSALYVGCDAATSLQYRS